MNKDKPEPTDSSVAAGALGVCAVLAVLLWIAANILKG